METVSDNMTKVVRLLADVETALLYDLGPHMASSNASPSTVPSPGMPEMQHGLPKAKK